MDDAEADASCDIVELGVTTCEKVCVTLPPGVAPWLGVMLPEGDIVEDAVDRLLLVALRVLEADCV